MPWHPTDRESIRFHLQLPSTATTLAALDAAMAIAEEPQIITAQQAIADLDDLMTDLLTMRRDGSGALRRADVLEWDAPARVRNLEQAIAHERQVLTLCLGEFGAALTAQPGSAVLERS